MVLATDISNQTRKKRWILIPQTPETLIYSIICLTCLLYNGFVIPFRIAFLADPLKFSIFPVTIFYIVDSMTDIWFMFDVFYRLFGYAYIDKHQRIISDHKLVAMHYLHTQFAYDIVTSFPFDWIAFASGVSSTLLPYIRITRLIRFFHLPRYFATIEKYVEKFSYSSTGVLRLVKLCIILLACCHFAACVFFCSALSGITHNSFSWASVSWVIQDGAQSAVVFRQYLRSLYWGIAVILVVYCGDIAPLNYSETCVMITMITVSYVTCGAFIASCAAIIANSNTHTLSLSIKQQEVNNYLHCHKIPNELSGPIHKFFNYSVFRFKAIDENYVLQSLPPFYRFEILSQLILRSVRAISLFSDCSAGFIACIVRQMKAHRFVPNQYVCYAGEMKKSAYIIYKGKMRILPETFDEDNDSNFFSSDGIDVESLLDSCIISSSNDNKKPSSSSPTYINMLKGVQHNNHSATGVELTNITVGVGDRVSNPLSSSFAGSTTKEIETNIVLSSGDCVGASSLLKPARRCHSIQAIGFVETYEITGQMLERAFCDFPQERAIVQRNFNKWCQNRRLSTSLYVDDEQPTSFTFLDEKSASQQRQDSLVETHIRQYSLSQLSPVNSSLNIGDLSSDKPLSSPRLEHRRAISSSFRDLSLTQSTSRGHRHTRSGLVSSGVMSELPESRFKQILPNSTFRLLWDSICMFFLLFHIICVPFSIAFGSHDASTNILLLIVLYTTDLFFLIDIGLRWELFLENKDGRLVLDQSTVKQMYIHGWFTIDLISSLPIDIIVLAMGYGFIAAILRILKLTRVFRIRCYRESLDEFSHRRGIFVDSMVSRIVSFYALLFLFIHWAGCIFYFIAVVEDSPQNWTRLLGDSASLLEIRSSGYLYSRSIYFVVQTFSTVGYGDISARTSAETVFQIILQVTTCVCFAALIGYSTSILQSTYATMAKFEEKIDVLHTYMDARFLSTKTRQRLLLYYRYLWQHDKGVPDSIITAIPEQLRSEVMFFRSSHMLEHVFWLQDLHPEFYSYLSGMLERRVLLPYTYVVREYEICKCMYFVESGKLEVLENGKVTSVITSGGEIGENLLLSGKQWCFDARSIEYCELLVLYKTSLDNVLQMYPQYIGKFEILSQIYRPDNNIINNNDDDDDENSMSHHSNSSKDDTLETKATIE